MATFTLNINAVKSLIAADKNYIITTLTDPINLNILIGDTLGKEPTQITNVTTFTLGTIIIDPDINARVIFTPNGTLGTDSFDYTITDSLSRTSSATITITTS